MRSILIEISSLYLGGAKNLQTKQDITSLGIQETLCVNCQLLPLPSAAGKETLRVGHHLLLLQRNAWDCRYHIKNTWIMNVK